MLKIKMSNGFDDVMNSRRYNTKKSSRVVGRGRLGFIIELINRLDFSKSYAAPPPSLMLLLKQQVLPVKPQVNMVNKMKRICITFQNSLCPRKIKLSRFRVKYLRNYMIYGSVFGCR